MLTLVAGIRQTPRRTRGGHRRLGPRRARRIFAGAARPAHYRVRQRNADLRTAFTRSARRRSRCTAARTSSTRCRSSPTALFRYLCLLDRQHAAEDPSRLMLTDHHLQGAALGLAGRRSVWMLRTQLIAARASTRRAPMRGALQLSRNAKSTLRLAARNEVGERLAGSGSSSSSRACRDRCSDTGSDSASCRSAERSMASPAASPVQYFGARRYRSRRRTIRCARRVSASQRTAIELEVVAGELRRPGDAQPIAEPRKHDLLGVVGDADRRRRRPDRRSCSVAE